MKTVTVPTPLNAGVLVLALLTAALVFAVVTEKRLPLVSNIKFSMSGLLVLGMAMCTLGGIGRVAALNEWAHPLAILGYVLGALILLIGIATIFGFKLPLIKSDLQAFIVVAILIGVKIADTVLHSLFLKV